MIMAERWILAVMGVWLIIAPWVLGFSDDFLTKWASILCGIILVFLNAKGLSEKREKQKNI